MRRDRALEGVVRRHPVVAAELQDHLEEVAREVPGLRSDRARHRDLRCATAAGRRAASDRPIDYKAAVLKGGVSRAALLIGKPRAIGPGRCVALGEQPGDRAPELPAVDQASRAQLDVGQAVDQIQRAVPSGAAAASARLSVEGMIGSSRPCTSSRRACSGDRSRRDEVERSEVAAHRLGQARDQARHALGVAVVQKCCHRAALRAEPGLEVGDVGVQILELALGHGGERGAIARIVQPLARSRR